MVSDEQFLDDIKYFWTEKWDIERYTEFDLKRLYKLDFNLAHSWTEYKKAIGALNFNCK